MLMSLVSPVAFVQLRCVFALPVWVCVCVFAPIWLYAIFICGTHTCTRTQANTAVFIFQQTHQERVSSTTDNNNNTDNNKHTLHTCAWCAFNFYGGSRLDSRLRCPDWFVYLLAQWLPRSCLYIFFPSPPLLFPPLPTFFSVSSVCASIFANGLGRSDRNVNVAPTKCHQSTAHRTLSPTSN